MAKSICSVEDCPNRVNTNGYCAKHWWRVKENGSPFIVRKTPTGEPWRWLKDQIGNRPPSNECWEWPYQRHSDGYGMVRIDSRTPYLVHPIALKLSGDMPTEERRYALHSCDNPPCFNPAHLRWGTIADNSADMVTRNRSSKGSHRPLAKLTESDIPKIRVDNRLHREIARDYGVSPTLIGAIKRRTKWRHVV